MTGTVLTPTNIDYLDHLFNWPTIRPVPAQFLADVPQNDLSLWCLKRGIYQVPTIELLEFLVAQGIEPGVITLEIGAGSGHIGRALGILMIDNKMQTWPHIQAYYADLKQPTIRYGLDVETMPALKAVESYQPEIVLACWITQALKPGFKSGNLYGVDELRLLEMPSVARYILVGNHAVHGDKEIIQKVPHQEYRFGWLYSRSMRKEQNAIWIFNP